jgi:carotenoid cleavage dioxygenase-like enzyme
MFNLLNILIHGASKPSKVESIGISTSPAISKNFLKFFDDSPVEVISQKLRVTGKLPTYLSGCLLRNGPAIFGNSDNLKPQRFSHLFDGLAKITKYEFNQGNILFSTKFIRSNFYKELIDNNKLIPIVTIGSTIPRFKGWDKVKIIFNSDKTDNTAVSIAQAGRNGSYFAITDSPVIMEFDVKTLETVGRGYYKDKSRIIRFGGKEMLSTAHPTLHPHDGNLYNYFLEVRPVPIPFLPKTNIAHITRMNHNLERTVIGSVELGKGVIPYIHDFSVTSNYAVLMIWPVRLDFSKITNGGGLFGAMSWQGDRVNTIIHVFDLRGKGPKEGRYTRPLKSFTAPPMFSYHHVNAFEKEGENGVELVVDVTGYKDGEICYGENGFLLIPNMKNPSTRSKQVRDGDCYRFILPLSESQENGVSNSSFIQPFILPMIDASGMSYTGEMARVNDIFKGRQYRFSYCVTSFAGCDVENRGGFLEWALVKRDHDIALDRLRHKTSHQPSVITWSDAHCYPSEPVFVPNPEGKSEDDGLLLSEVYDAVRGESFLCKIYDRTCKSISGSNKTFIFSRSIYYFMRIFYRIKNNKIQNSEIYKVN